MARGRASAIFLGRSPRAHRMRRRNASFRQRLLDGGHVHALHTGSSLAVFEDEEHGLDAALVICEERDFVQR